MPVGLRIDLAHVGEFRLGALTARPAVRQVVRDDGRSEVLEPRVMQVLVALAGAGGAILTRDDLTECCWDGRVVGEDAINRVISRLRRVGEGIGRGEFRIETITKVGYRLVHDDPSDAAPTAQSFDSSSAEPGAANPKRRRIGRGTALALLAAVLLMTLAGGAWWLRHARAAKQRVVLIEPLRVPPGDRNAELLQQVSSTDLSRMIVGNDATLAIVDSDDDPVVAQRAADYVVRGEARSVGATLHTTVRLLDSRNAAMLWSTDVVRPAVEIDSLRQELAVAVGDVLVCAFGNRAPAPGYLDEETMRLYLAACEGWHSGWARTSKLLEQVVRRKPNFAHAQAMYAVSVALNAQSLPPYEARKAIDQAMAAARRALALDRREGMAYGALTLGIPDMADWTRRTALLRAGLSVDPDNAALHTSLSVQLADVGRADEAREHARRAAALDPFAPVFASNLAESLAFSGRRPEAMGLIEQIEARWPRDPLVGTSRFDFMSRVGDPAEMLAMLKERRGLPDISARRLAIWKLVLEARAHPTKARTAAAVSAIEAASHEDEPGQFSELVQHLVQLGQIDAAFTLIGRVPSPSQRPLVSDSDIWFPDFMAPLRNDPRFMTLAAQRGLAAVWQQTGVWPDFCNGRSAPYDCKKEAMRALSTNPRALIRPTA